MELFTPDFGLVFWMFLAFIILFAILAKWGWPVILKNIDERADKIDKGVEYAQEARAQLDSARADAQKYIEEAQIKQAEMLRDAAKMKSQIIEEAKNEAAKEAQKVMDAAKVSIEQSRKEAELQFRNEVSKFSLEIAEKMVRNQLSNDKAQTELVNKMLDEIEKN
ncbi:MAG: F0F1 ATP synthase subunit B [Muribaculaceae bacterium]|nr:F0F1 ATP synthase subunit B [Muribaculaceae bacterium]MDE6337789.1 F0F1 ATP synthase subunit B [Muribaculaceae bacterium]MDE6770746.1 F0F1 ATP synthase subunit B [Muribaculaceae bacterium]MDE6795080.1 F0F1 ATP synthase subunit B [Muribaculaceae bacterium]